MAPSRFKRIVAWLGVSLAALGAAYLAGRFQTASKIDVAEQGMRAAGEARDRMNEELRAERARVERLQSRRALHLALAALDERNFGIAQAQLQAAAKSLEKGSAGAPAGLAELQRDVGGARLVATEDVAVQRQRVIDFTRRLDALEPPR